MSTLDRRRFLTAVLGAVALVTPLAACGSGGSAPATPAAATKTLAVISPYYSDQPTTKEVVDAFQTKAQADGYTLLPLKDTKGDLSAVNNEIQNAVAQKVTAIVLGQGDPQQFGAGLAAAKQAGIPVVGLDAGVAPGIAANVTSDNAFLGTKSADALVDAIGGKGSVIMIGFDGFEPVRLRDAAAKKVFADKGIQVIEYLQGDAKDSTGFAKTKTLELLTKYPKGSLQGIWGGWDATSLGIYQATQAAGRTEVIVTGVDGQPFARAEVRKGGNWVATVQQDWSGIAAAAVTTLDGVLAGKPPADPTVLIPGQVLDKTNA